MIEFDASLGLGWLPTAPGTPDDTPSVAPGATAGSAPASSSLQELERRHADSCDHCRNATGHQRLVFGEGGEDARIMFIGEAPGAEEDRVGRPFVGEAGKLLDRMLTAVELARSEVYIANVLKSRPPDNRTPTPEEAARCGAWLERQIAAVSPQVIVCLGAVPTKFILRTAEGITRARGRWGTYRSGDLDIPVLPTFHPAYVLRQYTPEVRGAVWNDLREAKARAYPD